jgi:hypothetical protein
MLLGGEKDDGWEGWPGWVPAMIELETNSNVATFQSPVCACCGWLG